MKLIILVAVLSLAMSIKVSHEADSLSGNSYTLNPRYARLTSNTIGPIKFADSTLSFRGCNNYNCRYSLIGNKFHIKGCASTKMFCPNSKDELLSKLFSESKTIKLEKKTVLFFDKAGNIKVILDKTS